MLGFDVAALLQRMTSAAPGASGAVFSVGLPPMLRVDGVLKPLKIGGLERLTPFHTEMVAVHLLAHVPEAAGKLRRRGAAAFVVSVPGRSRYRASVMRQRGSLVAELREIPPGVPKFEELGLPAVVAEAAAERTGLVLVNGPSGSGRSTTMAAILDEINRRRPCHVVTAEDPIEYLHRHQKAIVHQREVGTDIPDLATGLEDALQSGAEVLMVTEVRDHATARLVLEGAETGHLVLASVRGLDTGAVLDRLVSLLGEDRREAVCRQLAGCLRLSLTQRLLRTRDGKTVPVMEVWRSLPSTRGLLERGELGSAAVGEVLRDAVELGTAPLDAELERLVHQGVLDRDQALAEAVNPRQLELRLMGLGGGR